MTTTKAQEIVVKLKTRVYAEPSHITGWLLDSRTRFAFDKNNFSMFDCEQYVFTDTDFLEYYDDAHRYLARAIGYCWNADKHAALMVIERLMALLEYNYQGHDVCYNIMLTKLNVMRYIIEF